MRLLSRLGFFSTSVSLLQTSFKLTLTKKYTKKKTGLSTEFFVIIRKNTRSTFPNKETARKGHTKKIAVRKKRKINHFINK